MGPRGPACRPGHPRRPPHPHANPQTSYNPNSPTSLAVSGVFDSISTGILIYMALVDLIAVDFTSSRFRADGRLQMAGYGALVLGAGLMTLLALWA